VRSGTIFLGIVLLGAIAAPAPARAATFLLPDTPIASPFGTLPHVGPRDVEEIVVHTRTITSPTNFWNTPLPDDVALDPTAIDAPAELARKASRVGTYVNRTAWTANVEIVPPDQPLVPVLLRRADNGPKLAAVLATGVPIPAGWQPTADSDARGIFYQPNYVSPDGRFAGRLYELQGVRREDPALSGGFAWSATWGGRMSSAAANPGHWISWQYSGYRYATPADPDSTYQRKEWGATATGLPDAEGTIAADDVAKGRINHALLISLPYSRPCGASPRWPAQRCDGYKTGNPLVEGLRIRLPPGYQSRCTIPLGRMVDQALTEYGAVIGDSSGAVTVREEPRAPAPDVPGYTAIACVGWGAVQVLAVGSDAAPNVLQTRRAP
jgi:hypothetical protein